ncbi:hypothetical protein Tco_0304267 [Tanacetum coccineum]
MSSDTILFGCQKIGTKRSRLGCAEKKVATWNDLAFKIIILRWNVKHRNIAIFLKKVDPPNGDALRKCILEGPYTPSTVTIPAVPATDDYSEVPETLDIGDEIYSTIDVCKTTHDMWIAIESTTCRVNLLTFKMSRLICFGSLENSLLMMESRWSHTTSDFYNMMNEMIRNNLTQYHKLFDVLKQYQKEVNEIRVERIAKNANPLELVVILEQIKRDAAQPHPDPYYQAPKSHKSYATTSKESPQTRSHATIKHKGKEKAKPITPPSESASEEDSDPEQAQRIRKCRKIWHSLQSTSRSSTNLLTITLELPQTLGTRMKPKRVKDSTYHKEKMLLCKQAEKGIPLQAEQSDWQANRDKEIDEQELEAHYSLMAKIQEVPIADSGTDTESLEQVQYDAGYNVSANERQHSEQLESISNTCVVEKVDETSRTLRESNSIRDSCLIALQNKQTEFKWYKTLNDHTVDYEKLEHKLNETLGLLAQKEIDIKEGLKLKSYEILVVKEKHDKELVDQAWEKHSHNHFRAPTALDMEVLIKTCLMPLAIKTQNDSFAFVHELKQEMHADLKYVESLEKEIDELESDKAEFSNMYDILLQECVSNDVMCSYLHSLSDLDAHAELQCLYVHKVKECECLT